MSDTRTTGLMALLLPILVGSLHSTTVIAADNGPMAIRLEQEGRTARIRWTDPDGAPGMRYEIERGTDRTLFVLIGVFTSTEPVASLTERSFVDLAPLPGTSYYRVRAVDGDGAERSSSILSMMMEAPDNEMVAWPNPTNDLVNVVFGEERHPCSIHITDADGNTNIHLPMDARTGTVGIGLGDLPGGTYLVTAWMDDGSQQQVRVVKR